MTTKQKTTCPRCKRRFKNLGNHWQNNESHRRSIPNEYMDVLKGVLMGDGVISTYDDAEPCMVISMINRDYLEYLDDKLGWLTNGVTYEISAKDKAERDRDSGFNVNAKAEGYHDAYKLSTMSHSNLKELSSWYSTGKKRFPNDLELNAVILKHWYVTDGGLSWPGSNVGERARAGISSSNESNRVDYLQSLFDDIGLETYWSNSGIWMNPSQTEVFLQYIGDSVPGFQYKWENKRKNVYGRLKREAYEQDYESPQTTLEGWGCHA